MKFTKTYIASLVKNPSSLKNMPEVEIVDLLQQANYGYYISGKPLFTDDMYDIVKNELEKKNSKHPILKNIGAAVADDSRKAKLPIFMGSMDKIKSDESVLSTFAKKYPGTYYVSDKLDGNSALYVKTKDGAPKLYSRGDGEYGQDISHLIPFISGMPDQNIKEELVVRGELIISKKEFEEIKERGANARNMVAGLANAKVPDLDIAKRVTFVAYNLFTPHMTLSKQYSHLSKLGFNVVYNRKLQSLNFTMLSKELLHRRASSPFEIDGMIVHHDGEHKVVAGKNPAYAFAFKMLLTQETAEVVVSEIEWNISKDKLIKPTVIFEPVKMNGVVIRRATGFNANYIDINKLGPGARIVITRSGDVIPHILKTLTPSPSGPQFPNLQYVWTDTHVDIMVSEESDEYNCRVLEQFFRKLDVKGISTGTVKKLFNAGFETVNDVINMTDDDFNSVEGLTRKAQLWEMIHSKLKTIDCVTLMECSNTFGRGFGERKLKMIVAALPAIVNDPSFTPTIEELCKIEGISKISANNFRNGLQKYRKFIKMTKLTCDKPPAKRVKIEIKPAKKNGDEDDEDHREEVVEDDDDDEETLNTNWIGTVVVFSGYRDQTAEKRIEALGGRIATSVSKKTTHVIVKDESSSSSKVITARRLGITVLTSNQLASLLQ